MAKHPVPKKKHSKTRTKRRYKTYANKARTRLAKEVRLVDCSNCGKARRVHHACTHCGMYRGRPVLNMESKMKKVTKIQA